ncbi:hypothetical protein CAPTEDRAFT_213699 [Capitella teleta]|uniref:Microtubule-associated protein 9 n=1 Tax=Capitella teleta TaxID=283909 RepID=R7V7U6_CAPTE|nr:hypothetical protein CAPTEDRAFT_213699 [Capitella teleta]|eukprot:ELU14933.1 hypothetical protein CAPTEDRAFT_213699 [Capitella teleta]
MFLLEISLPLLMETPKKTTFQRELEAKMKERKKKGLSVEISSSNDSEDELGSDNELLSHFNMTSKKNDWSASPRNGRKSPYEKSSSPYSSLFGAKKGLLSDDDDEEEEEEEDEGLGKGNLMMTMKKPWQTAALQETVDAKKKSRALSALDEIAAGKSGNTNEKPKEWQPPSYRKKSVTSSPEPSYRKSPRTVKELDKDEDDEKEERRMAQRPKSPNIRGRKASLLDSIEKQEKPSPVPRRKKDKDQESPLSSRKERDEESPRPKPRVRAKGIFDDDFGKKEPISTTPKSPKSAHSSPSVQRRKSKSSIESPKENRKTDEKKSILNLLVDEPVAKPKKKPRRGLLASSSSESEEDEVGFLSNKGRKSRNAAFTSSLEEERAKRREKNEDSVFMQKPTLKKGKENGIGEEGSHPVPTQRNVPSSHERESSVCREVEEDPTKYSRVEDTPQEKKKSQTSEKQLLDDAIDYVEGAQLKEEKEKPRPSNAPFVSRNICECCKSKAAYKIALRAQEKRPKSSKFKVQPRYTKPQIPAPDSARTVDFNSTTDIREAVYLDWYAQKMERAKQELKEKKKKEQEEEEKKKKQQEEKILEAKMSFQAWNEKKKEVLSKKAREKERELEKKKRKELDETKDKIKESEVSFKMWKENKDAYLREKEQQKKREEERKIREEKEKKRMREKDSQSAFHGWKSKKDVKILEKTVEIKKTEKQIEKEKLREQRKREREAEKAYERWISKKEQYEDDRPHSRHLEDLEASSRPAWSPASRTIPVGH